MGPAQRAERGPTAGGPQANMEKLSSGGGSEQCNAVSNSSIRHDLRWKGTRGLLSPNEALADARTCLVRRLHLWPDEFRRHRPSDPLANQSVAEGVPVKKSIRPAVTEFERRGMLAARVGPEPSSLTTRSCDDPRPQCLGLRPRPPQQLSRRRAGECRPPSSTGGAAAISRPTPTPLPGPAPTWGIPRRGRPRRGAPSSGHISPRLSPSTSSWSPRSPFARSSGS
jgi:hypothetical protein